MGCRRKICFFAHTLEELRVSTVKVSGSAWLMLLCLCLGFMGFSMIGFIGYAADALPSTPN